MDLRQEPTVNDLANMLDSIDMTADDVYPGTLHVLRWLIESSPPAREIYDRLHARRDREPSLIELARLMFAVENGEPYSATVHTVYWLIARSAKASELHQRLEQMAGDAGCHDRDHDWAVSALAASVEIDRLLATLDDWQDAGDAVQLKMGDELDFEVLLTVCRARIARSEGDERARLDRLRRRLQTAVRREIRVEDPEERLNEIESKLRSLADPVAALATVEELSRRQRSS